MHPLSRRSVALIATAATLGAGSLATVAQASSAASRVNSSSSSLLGLPGLDLTAVLASIVLGTPVQQAVSGLTPTQLGSLLDLADPAGSLNTLLAGLTPSQLNDAVASLPTGQLATMLSTFSPTQTGDLLAPLSGVALSNVLGLLSTSQLTGALATLTPAELTTLLPAMSAPEIAGVLGAANPTQLLALLSALPASQLSSALLLVDPTQLTSIVGVLTPAQITALIAQPGGTQSVVSGLSGEATGLGSAPSAASVNVLLEQVTALLNGGLPTVPGTEGLLATVNSLLGVAGLDPSMLLGLLSSADRVGGTAPSPISGALQTVIGTLGGVLGVATGTPGGAPAGTPTSTTTRPGGSGAKPGVGFNAYRAAIGSVKVAKNRRSAKIAMSCPSIAPRGCVVTLTGVVAGKKAFTAAPFVLMRNLTVTKKVTLSRAAAKRLKKKGGSLKVSALTSYSTLAAVTKTVRVARAR